MGIIRSILRPTIFGLIVLMFFLPFVRVSCTGNNNFNATMTGVEIAFGTEIKETGSYWGWSDENNTSTRKTKPEPIMIAIFVIAVVGFFVVMLKSRVTDLIMVLCGLLGVVLMLVSKNKFEKDVLREGVGLFRLEFMPAFWITLALFVVAIIVGAFFYLSQERKRQTEEVTTI